jgi:crossover junction endodeoxyribonuclease RuvC
MKLLGVDGGIRGGLSIVDVSGLVPQLIAAIDIPVIGVGAKERVDVQTIRDWIAQHAPQHAFIERAQAMPRQGASSGFKYGRAVGAIEAVITCCAIPLTIVEPAMWKKFHRLAGGDKEGARQRALQLFPAAHVLLARKRDHGRAEAALIAYYGLRVHAEFERRGARARKTCRRRARGARRRIRKIGVSGIPAKAGIVPDVIRQM